MKGSQRAHRGHVSQSGSSAVTVMPLRQRMGPAPKSGEGNGPRKDPKGKDEQSFAVCSSVAQLSLTLCNPMNCSTPGFPVLHQLLELAQTCIHRVGDTIQLFQFSVVSFSRLQSFPASGSFPRSQFFTSGGQSIGASVSVLLMNIQG